MSDEVRATIEIEAAVEDVWETVMDPDRLADWVTTHHSLGEVSGRPLREGSTMEQKMRLGAIPFEVSWRLAKADPPRLAEWEGRGPAGSRAHTRYELGEQDGGTRFDYTSSFELPGGVLGRRAAKALTGSRGEQEARESLERLKSLLESGPKR